MADDIIEVFRRMNYLVPKDALPETLHFFSKERADVRDLIEKLSWNESKEDQNKAIDSLAHDLFPCEYIYLVLPDKYTAITIKGETKYYKLSTGKARWENAAKTIIQIGWPKVDHIVVPLFVWLLDSNWPGSQLIYDFILSLPKDVLLRKISEIVDNPENYRSCEYTDLAELIDDLTNYQ